MRLDWELVFKGDLFPLVFLWWPYSEATDPALAGKKYFHFFHHLMNVGIDVPCILMVTSYMSGSLRPSLPLYIDVSHCPNSAGSTFDVLAEQSSVLTHLGNTPAWNPEHDSCVNQSINTSTLPVHVC